jgi:hypothetical protein
MPQGSLAITLTVAYFIKERAVSFIGCDRPNDVQPTGLPASVGIPLHQLALVAMGVSIFDNLDFERAIEQAKRLNRYEFLFTAAPLRIELGTRLGSCRPTIQRSARLRPTQHSWYWISSVISRRRIYEIRCIP